MDALRHMSWDGLAALGRWLRVNFIISLSIGITIHLLFDLAARVLAHARIGAFGMVPRTCCSPASPSPAPLAVIASC